MKVTKVNEGSVEFEDGSQLYSDHEQDCCENHYLWFGDVTLEDFDGLEFDLSGDDFFKRIEGYGIELVPVHGHSVKVPGYGYNNGYYSSNLDLILTSPTTKSRVFPISECQVISD